MIPNSFKSHTFHFKHVPNGPVYPDDKDLNAVAEHKLKLLKHPYDGNPDTPYGPPADFDIIWCKIETTTGEQFMVAMCILPVVIEMIKFGRDNSKNGSWTNLSRRHNRTPKVGCQLEGISIKMKFVNPGFSLNKFTKSCAIPGMNNAAIHHRRSYNKLSQTLGAISIRRISSELWIFLIISRSSVETSGFGKF